MFLFRQVLLLVLVAGICWGYHLPEETDEDYETREERNISPSRNNNGRCLCNTRYIPFCGTDGVTYSNKCQLECAQNSKPGNSDVYHESLTFNCYCIITISLCLNRSAGQIRGCVRKGVYSQRKWKCSTSG